MVRIECTSCKYRGSALKVPPRCPYCGTPGTIRQQKDAQSILNEISLEH